MRLTASLFKSFSDVDLDVVCVTPCYTWCAVAVGLRYSIRRVFEQSLPIYRWYITFRSAEKNSEINFKLDVSFKWPRSLLYWLPHSYLACHYLIIWFASVLIPAQSWLKFEPQHSALHCFACMCMQWSTSFADPIHCTRCSCAIRPATGLSHKVRPPEVHAHVFGCYSLYFVLVYR